MYRHRLDLLSLLLGAAFVSIGIIASTDRLGSLINGRPDSLIPVAALIAGALVMFVAVRRTVAERPPALIDADGDQSTGEPTSQPFA